MSCSIKSGRPRESGIVDEKREETLTNEKADKTNVKS